MRVEEDELCTECSDNEQKNVWSTDNDEGEVTTSFEPLEEPAQEQSTREERSQMASSETTSDTSETIDTNEPSSEESEDTGSHIIDPMWDSKDISISDLEAAAKEAARSTIDQESALTDPLDSKIDNWKEQLLDLTRRSDLVNFTTTKTKSLPFHRANPIDVAEILFEREPLYIHRSGLLHNSAKHVDDEAVKKTVQRCSGEI